MPLILLIRKIGKSVIKDPIKPEIDERSPTREQLFEQALIEEQEHVESDGLHHMNFPRFFFLTALQAVIAFAIFWKVAPVQFGQEFSQPLAILGWTLFFGIPISLFEYLYHRYLLHSAILPFLGSMHKAHSDHHGLTSVKAPVTPKDPEKFVLVNSEYPILHKHQEESMQFPWFAISIFLMIFVAALGPIKFLLPKQPIIAGIIIASTLCYAIYEFWHALLHLPYTTFWKPLMDNPRIGKVVDHVYSFHLLHHWRPVCNLAVVGLWGFATWDHLFQTHRRPFRLPHNGALVNYSDIELKKPRFPISLIDKVQPKMYKTSRSIEKTLAKMVGIKPK